MTNKSAYNKWKLLAIISIALVFASFALPLFTSGAETRYYPDASYFEYDEKSEYSYSNASKVSSFSYGSALGRLKLTGGGIREIKTAGGFLSYDADGSVNLGYEYGGECLSGEKDEWNLESDSSKSIRTREGIIQLSSKAGKGVLIAEKSTDGREWNKTAEYTNFFESNPGGLETFITVSNEDITAGVYFRITLCYRMKRATGQALGFLWNEYEHRKFAEEYVCYIINDSSSVSVKDIVTGSTIEGSSTTEYGFKIDKNGTLGRADVTIDGKKRSNVPDGASFTEPGVYYIDITTAFGKKYSAALVVSTGLALDKLTPEVYSTGDNYSELQNLNGGKTVYGAASLTGIYLTRKTGDSITALRSDASEGIDRFGLDGDRLWIYARLNYDRELTSNGWKISRDTFGKTEGETVQGVITGEIASGAVIVQTSNDGKNWTNADRGKYAAGLYTTDFCFNYPAGSDILVYTPSGQDIIRGIYIRVMFAYETSNGSETRNYLEKYEFYLCNESLEAITIHNLTVADSLKESLRGEDGDTADLYRYAETLINNSLTVNGFRLDTSKNPTITYTVNRNGKTVPGSRNEFTETGKYEIVLHSKVGTQKIINVYVDREDLKAVYERYFGSSLITEDSKRIYSADSDYPVFEGGKTFFHINAVPDEFLPVSGVIRNLSRSGTEIKIEPTRTEKKQVISVPGEYEAEFRVNPSFFSDAPCGDDIVFTFHFYVIAEGTAPGPQENKKNLAEYSHKNISDSKPIYYGVTYSSAASGNITVAFATREEALAFARNYEQGVVEKQADGSFRYTGSMIVSQKQRINSSWDLADAIDYFAKLAVKELYFDLSDSFTFTTLSDDVISQTGNLRRLELKESIVVFGEDGQKIKMTGYNRLPLLSPKPQRFLSVEGNDQTKTSFADFQFVRDKLGIDSDHIVIIDCNGKEYDIEYLKGVGAQLNAYDCPSGEITIKEYTKYGDVSEYRAVYIRPDDNETEVGLRYYDKDKDKTVSVKGGYSSGPIITDAFSISNIFDPVDDYPLVLIIYEGTPLKAYTSDSKFEERFTKPGKYSIKCVNRLGYSYEIPVIVNSDTGCSLSVSFTGEGTEKEKPIVVYLGQTNVLLPDINRYGYYLEGFKAADGSVYSGEIEKVLSDGDIVLEAIWKAKQYKARFVDEENRLIKEQTVSFGESISLSSAGSDKSPLSAVAWLCNGETVTGDTYVVDKEGDLVFKAVGERSYTSVDSTDGPNSGSGGKKYSSIIIGGIVGGIILITAVTLGIIKARKNNGKSMD